MNAAPQKTKPQRRETPKNGKINTPYGEVPEKISANMDESLAPRFAKWMKKNPGVKFGWAYNRGLDLFLTQHGC